MIEYFCKMDLEYLKKCVDNNMSSKAIGKDSGKHSNTVIYWLKKHNLSTNYLSFKDKGIIIYNSEKFCPKCCKNKEISEFYQRRGKEGGSVYCKICTNTQTLKRQRKLKENCVQYKGGKCVKCDYNKCNAALEFHHLVPTEKDFNISDLKRYTFNDKIKTELDKCILVCSNCHREIHDLLNKLVP